MRTVDIPSNIMTEIKTDKQQLQQLKQQNRIVSSLQQKIVRRESEIEELQRLVMRYKKSYDDYDVMKATHATISQDMERLNQENRLLIEEMSKVVEQGKQLQAQLLIAEKQKQQLSRQRYQTDKRLRDIEQTFHEYQDECRNKQRNLLIDLEKAYKDIKELNQRISEMRDVAVQNEELKAKINSTTIWNNNQSHPSIYQSVAQQHNTSIPSNTYGPSSHQKSAKKSNKIQTNFIQEIQRLRKQLTNKQQQLQRSKLLNHQLSIQFDKSVSKVCEFEKQLSAYRKQNHELKKTLSLFVERQHYEKMHKNRIAAQDSQNSESQQDSSQSGDKGIIRHSSITESQHEF